MGRVEAQEGAGAADEASGSCCSGPACHLCLCRTSVSFHILMKSESFPAGAFCEV